MGAAIPLVVAITSIAGLGLSFYGQQQQAKAAKQRSDYERQIAEQQQRAEQLRRQQAALDQRRKSAQAERERQKAIALGAQTGANQGALYGSGVAGGFGQISGYANTNLLGIQQSGEILDLLGQTSDNISQSRFGIAGTDSAYAQGAGFASIGNSLFNAAPTIGKLSGGFAVGSPYGGSSGRSSPFNYTGSLY